MFVIEDEQWHGYASESVWAKEISDNQFQILNTPFFAKGVSYLDVVVTELQNGVNICKSIVGRSGHSTYRLILKTDVPPHVFPEYWRALETLGCTYERGEFGYVLLALDVPDPSKLNAVYDHLGLGEKDGIWAFEEGYAHIGEGLIVSR